MKKIFWIHTHFDYWMGGTKYIFEVIRRLSKEYEVTVIVDSASEIAIENFQKVGVDLKILSLPSSNNVIYWLTLPIQIILRRLLIKGIGRSPDYVISSMFPSNVIAYGISQNNYQLCFEPFAFFHDDEFINGFSYLKKMFIKLAKFLYSKIDIKYTRKSKRVFTLNNVTKLGIKKIYSMNAIMLFAGIDTKHFHHHVNQSLKRKWKNKKVIIHSTDYSPVKRTESMVIIFQKVYEKRNDVELIITSTINNESEVERLKKLAKKLRIEKKVHFLGFVPYDLLPQYYSLAEVLVQTSYSELSGTTSMALPVKEALACETWCIRSPVTQEDVVDGDNGYLVDPRDESRMVSRIIEVLNKPKREYREGAKRGRKLISNVYNWDKVVKRISDKL